MSILALALLVVAVTTIVSGFQLSPVTTNRVAIMATDISNADEKQQPGDEQSKGKNSLALKLVRVNYSYLQTYYGYYLISVLSLTYMFNTFWHVQNRMSHMSKIHPNKKYKL